MIGNSSKIQYDAKWEEALEKKFRYAVENSLKFHEAGDSYDFEQIGKEVVEIFSEFFPSHQEG